jgi:lysophospholipase L1-like esterase
VAQAGLFDLGFGAMGDSLTDEYQFEAYGNGTSGTARNWLEQLVADRGLNFGTLGTFSEPRRNAYEYNWARAGATSGSLLSGGQHTGLASQVSLGQVHVAFIFIGANDFLPTLTFADPYFQIAFGNPFDLNAFTNTLVGNIESAVLTAQAAGDVKVVLFNFMDPGRLPVVMSIPFLSDLNRQNVAAALENTINPALEALAISLNIPLIDIYGLSRDVGGSHLSLEPTLTVGGVDFDLLSGTFDPHTAFVFDGIHPDTVLQGINANLAITALNIAYGDLLGPGESLDPFTDLELLQHAGLGGEYVGETFSTSVDLSSYVTFQAPISEPIPALSTQGVIIFLLSVTGALVVWRRRSRTIIG